MAALAGQSARAAQCVSDALAARGIPYREANAWVWEHGPAYADICAACGWTSARAARSPAVSVA